jgi:hypothetical protein
VRLLTAIVTVLLVCSLGTLPARGSEVIYSNMVQETEYETGDCAGYTVRAVKNHSGELEIYFTAHEGNCSIKGQKAEKVRYIAGKRLLSFIVTSTLFTSGPQYRFQGRMTKDYLKGQLKIEYPPDPKYNKSETISLRRTTEKQLFQYR